MTRECQVLVPGTPHSGRTVLTANQVIVGDGTAPLVGAAVVIDGERIEAVGPLAEVARQDDRVVRYPGGTLIPGLINSHVHLTISHLDVERPSREHKNTEVERIVAAATRAARCLAAGVTTVRDVGSSDRGLFTLREMINRREVCGSRIFSSGGLICATGGHAYRIGHEADGADGMRRAVRVELKAGADFIKVMCDGGTSDRAIDIARPSLTDDELEAVVVTAHSLGRAVTGHAIAPLTIAAAIRAGMDAIEHGYALDPTTAAQMAEANMVLVPTLAVHETTYLHGEDDPRVWWMDIVKRSRESSRKAASAAISAGVRIAAGTDGGSPFNPHENLVAELLLLREVGMSPMKALEAATRVGAERLGADDQIGTLRAGLFADVVAVEGDPSQDLQVLRNPLAVYQAGQLVARRVTSGEPTDV